MGGAFVGPVVDVVGLAPVGRAVAAGPAAVPVTRHDGTEQRWRHGVGGDAVIEDVGPAFGEDAAHGAVARPALDRLGGEDLAVGRDSWPVVEEVVDADEGASVRTAASGGRVRAVFEVPAEDVDDGVARRCGAVRTGSPLASGLMAVFMARSTSAPSSSVRVPSSRQLPSGNGDRRTERSLREVSGRVVRCGRVRASSA